jgi:CRISPR-associated protein Csh1
MLDSLIKLGKEISKKRSKWDDIIHIPKIKDNKTPYVLNLIFDVDEGRIEISPDYLEEYNKDAPYQHKLLETLKGNAKKIYVAVLIDKIKHLEESLIGNGNARKGQLMEDIANIAPALKNTEFYRALELIYKLKDKENQLDKKYIKDQISLSNKAEIVFCYASIKAKDINNGSITELSHLDGFENFIDKKFFKTKKKGNIHTEQLDYSLGKLDTNIIEAKFQRGYNLNAMFVTTTINFASNFNNKHYHKNYQLSEKSIKYLDRASSYLINNLYFKIAGLGHMIVPEFLSFSNVNYEDALDNIYKRNDLLFNLKNFDEFTTSLQDEAEDQPYWLNYVTIDSDGNYFKASNLIKDVSEPYLLKIMRNITHINEELSAHLGRYVFNFYTLYGYIPIRDNTNRNFALEMFGDLFQQRFIERNNIFKFFIQYLICQKSGQFTRGKHNSYPNIQQKSSFDFAIQNAVTMYSAFIKLVDQLNLLKTNNHMETKQSNEDQFQSHKINETIVSFFKKMHYTESQISLFYLGRVLNTIAYAQYQKGHTSKPIMNKINYNGMDRDDIRRLRIDLEEKAKQYDILNKTEFNFSRFTDFFDYNNWNMNPEEAVFFILSGYSFFLNKE